MKKNVKKSLFFLLFVCAIPFFAQTNTTVSIEDDVYAVIENANVRGLCRTLPPTRPYTASFILKCLDEIEQNIAVSKSADYQKNMELAVIDFHRQRLLPKKNGLDLRNLSFRFEQNQNNENNENFPITFQVNNSINSYFSGGIYSNSSNNSFGYEVWDTLKFDGDIGKNVSYSCTALVEVSKMPLAQLGTYNIGLWWYDEGVQYEYDENTKLQIKWSGSEEDTPSWRVINKYRNYNCLPYSYRKKWDGSVYYLSKMDASGLEGWTDNLAFGMSMKGEIHASFKNGMIEVGIGRYNREWATMDNGSSLVLNSSARPFFGADVSISLFNTIRLSSITGFLEFPNQNYITDGAWYLTDGKGKKSESVVDSYFYHNLFSTGMFSFDYKFFHFDFGSSSIYPNRFELGYAFPLLDKVVYQNNVGDYDNLSLFGNLKFNFSRYGYVWGSVYVDEIVSPTANIFLLTRCMFAYQAGSKIVLPFIPFATLSVRYTKIEPYCYTHQAIFYQPYANNYISESYTNNGECLGYYLPPNSDEFFLRLEGKPHSMLNCFFQYQFIRHGVDWGSEQVPGSNLYSEMAPKNRDELNKFFLRDGTYEWTNVLSLGASINLNNKDFPLILYGTVGYVHNWFTSIGSEKPGKYTSYSKYSSSEYEEGYGLVITTGFNVFLK